MEVVKETLGAVSIHQMVDQIQVDPSTGCYVWKGPLRHGIYPIHNVAHPGRTLVTALSARKLMARFVGMKVKGRRFVATCGNPTCVNPKHIGDLKSLTRHTDNSGMARGEAHGRAVLDEDTVREIRARSSAGERQIEISRYFDISRVLVHNVVSRKSWSHI